MVVVAVVVVVVVVVVVAVVVVAVVVVAVVGEIGAALAIGLNWTLTCTAATAAGNESPAHVAPPSAAAVAFASFAACAFAAVGPAQGAAAPAFRPRHLTLRLLSQSSAASSGWPRAGCAALQQRPSCRSKGSSRQRASPLRTLSHCDGCCC